VSSRHLLWAGLFGFVLAASAAGRAGTIPMARPLPDTTLQRVSDARASRWLNAPIKDVPSRRKVLETKGRPVAGILGGTEQEVLRLCAIRVQFAGVPDPSMISGNAGKFDLRDERSTIFIDPAPHNRKFYLKHMEALSNYMSAMSYGRLKIEWNVFPLANDSAYVLPDVSTYNPEGSVGSWSLENLETFFKDAIKAADEDDNLRFSDFDAFVVIHAGSDWQNDIRGDSPYDLPSFFLALADTDSISVDEGTYSVKDGSVVPETSSQDGYLNGINGVIAHEVGHQLGLPDLYDTQYGLSAIGYWDLMDFGSGVGVVLADPNTQDLYYVTGILPASLSTWSKSFLGWVVPGSAGDLETCELRATELQGESPNRQAFAIPINSNEYYLIENRQCDLDGDSTGIVLSDPSPDSTGVIMGPVNANREFNYEYDWPLPGSGLLVWRVDRAIVDFGLPYDLVNGFWQRRGVSLAEADGIPDLGDYNSFYFLGSPWDPFYSGNNDRFADDTYPSTRSGTGCHSHIVVDQISGPANTMSFRVSYGWRRQGFPLALGDSLRFGVPSVLVADLDGDAAGDEVEAALTRGRYYTDTLGVSHVEYFPSEVFAFDYDRGVPEAVPGWPRRLVGSHARELVGADLDGDGRLETVASDESGRAYAFKPDGEAYFASSDTLGAFIHVEGGINGTPVAFDLDRDGRDELLLGTGDGLLVVGDAGATDLLGADRTVEPASQPVCLDSLAGEGGPVVVTYSEGALTVAYFRPGGSMRTLPVDCSAAPRDVFIAAADLDRLEDGRPEIVLATADGRVWCLDFEGRVLPGWGKKICDRIVGPPAFADIDSDGRLEVLLTDRNSETRAFTWSGSSVEGWPASWQGCTFPTWDYDFHMADTTISVPSAVVGDFGCTGKLGVFQGSLFECIIGWGAGGQVLEGFPLTLGGGCSAIAFGDLDGDGVMDMVAGGGDGNLYSFTRPGCTPPGRPSPWPAAYFDRRRNCVYPSSLLPEPPVLGTELLVAGSFHAFPNPATSSTVTFVFETETGGHARVEVFNLSGDIVKSGNFEAVARTSSSMDVSDLANGLYLCRLEVEGGGKSATEFFKLAVKR